MQLPAPTGVSARFIGTQQGTTTWYYWIQAIYPDGNSLLSSSSNTGAKALAALTLGQFNQVQWNPTPGAVGYIVWRATSATAPSTGGLQLVTLTSETGIKDDGSFSTTTTSPRYDGLYVWRAIYNFAVDGGAIAAITPAISDTIPAGAILVGGTINSTTAVTSAGSATVSVGTTAGSSAAALLAATAKASLSLDALINAVPVFATPVKMTAAGQINVTVAVAALTAGVIEIFIIGYVATNS